MRKVVPPNQTVLLDRDGTISVDHGYVISPDGVELIPGAASAIADMRGLGAAVYVVTNQSAVGRGMATMTEVDSTNAELTRLLTLENPRAVLDGILVCPHAPADDCCCRKPRTGLVSAHPVLSRCDPEQLWMVGDKKSDIDFARALGIPHEQTFLVLTGEGEGVAATMSAEEKLSAIVVPNLSGFLYYFRARLSRP